MLDTCDNPLYTAEQSLDLLQGFMYRKVKNIHKDVVCTKDSIKNILGIIGAQTSEVNTSTKNCTISKMTNGRCLLRSRALAASSTCLRSATSPPQLSSATRSSIRTSSELFRATLFRQRYYKKKKALQEIILLIGHDRSSSRIWLELCVCGPHRGRLWVKLSCYY